MCSILPDFELSKYAVTMATVIREEDVDDNWDGTKCYYVQCSQDGNVITGFCSSENLKQR